MPIPGLAMAGGQGGIDVSAGPATSGGTGRADGGSTFYFAPPGSQTSMTMQSLVWPALALGVAWLVLRKR